MKSIYRKLDVTSRADAVRTGAARGLLQQGSQTRSFTLLRVSLG